MRTLSTTVDNQTVTWRDKKRYLWLLGVVVPLLPFGAARESERFGLEILWWLGPIWVLLLIPLLDRIFGEDTSNPPDWAVEPLAKDHFYRWCTYLFLPVQLAGLIFACHVVTTQNLSWFAYLGVCLNHRHRGWGWHQYGSRTRP